MQITPQQLDDIIFEAMLEEYWETDSFLLTEKGSWLNTIKGAVNLAQKFGLDDKVAEMALSKIIGVGKGDKIESVMSLMSMIPDGGDEAGETGSNITGLMNDVMPAFKSLTKGNKTMEDVFDKFDDAKEKFAEIYEKIEPIKQWMVDNQDNVAEVISLIKARDVKGLDAFMGDVIPDVAHKKLKKILKKISKVVGKVGDMFSRFIDFVVKIDDFFGDGDLLGATPSGEAPATGEEAEEWKEDAAEELSYLNFKDIKSVAVQAVKDLRANEYYEPKYNVLNEKSILSLRFYTTPKYQINEQLMNFKKIIQEACGCEAPEKIDIDSALEELDDSLDSLLDDLNSEKGRMLDYGSSKSDSKEGRMTKAKLFRMGQMSQRLHDILFDEDDLPGWVNDKVTTAEDRLKSAHDYITYKVRNK